MVKRQRGLPHQIDPYRFADAGTILEGVLALTRLERLQALLEDKQGEVRYKLEFDRDEDQFRIVRMQLDTNLTLRCQRCMEALVFPVHHRTVLGFFRNEMEFERHGDRYEPVMVNEGMLNPVDIIEDELLLCLPQVPMHPIDECEARETIDKLTEEMNQAEEEKENPFAVLARLKSPDP